MKDRWEAPQAVEINVLLGENTFMFGARGRKGMKVQFEVKVNCAKFGDIQYTLDSRNG